MLSGPDCSAGHKTDAVPDDVKMLSAILDMFDDHPLVMKHFVTVLFFATFNDGQDLLVREAFTFHGIDADMM